MKIHDLNSIQAFVPKTAPGSNKSAAAFEAELNKTIQDLKASTQDLQSARPLDSTRPVFMSSAIDREEIVARLANFLDVMEQYSNKLGSTSTLKELVPLVDQIAQEHEQLKELAAQLPADDAAKEVLEESLIRSAVEVIRFNRGDYV